MHIDPERLARYCDRVNLHDGVAIDRRRVLERVEQCVRTGKMLPARSFSPPQQLATLIASKNEGRNLLFGTRAVD
jgi:hypothetical protein